MKDTFTLFWGSDFSRSGVIPSGPAVGAAPANLTGYTALIKESHPQLTGRVVMTIPAPLTGGIQFDFQWFSDMPLGRVMWFRPALVYPGGFEQSLNMLWVLVK